MNLKLPNFSTIIIVNKNQEQTRSLRVKTKHLNRLKHYLLITVCTFVALLGAVFYLTGKNRKSEAEKQQLEAQLTRLKNQLPVAVASTTTVTPDTATTYIEAIQSKLKKINDYLGKRGLGEFSIKTIVGAKAADEKLTANQQYSLYNNYLGRLLNNVAYTPMGYPRVSSMTSLFGHRSDPFNSESAENHPGVDFKGQKGDPVKCTASGKVGFAGWYGGYGNCVIIKHQNNFETLYGHLSKITVKVGEAVTVGEVVGKVGSTGHSTGTHLHYEVRVNGKPVNPVKFLSLNH